MKLFFISFILILITFTSCEFDLGNPLAGGGDMVDFTRMVIVQTEDGTPCKEAWLIGHYIDGNLYTDDNGKIPVKISISKSWCDSYNNYFEIYKNSTYRHVWKGRIEVHKGFDYKDVHITFPNY